MQKYYIAYHNNDLVRKKSSSGGAFSAISDIVLNKYNGIVYGCILNEDFNAVHIRSETQEDRDKMRGSKYIQSDLTGIFDSVKQDLKNNKKVLFSGTPCQISGILSYLNLKNISTENLITVEVTCHGVGSNKYFKDYINYYENRYRSKAISCNFRAKEKPTKIQQMKIEFLNKKKYVSSSSKLDLFLSLYQKNLLLRPSCYYCKYAVEKRNADITIADAWGYKTTDNKVRSLIITNSKIGEEIIKLIKNDMKLEIIKKEDVKQNAMKRSALLPQNREKFWEVYLNKGFIGAQKYTNNISFKTNIKRAISNFLYVTNLDKYIKNKR